jgi:hypothetical protein
MNQKLGRPDVIGTLLLDHAASVGVAGFTLNTVPHASTLRAVNYAAKRLVERGQLVRRYEFTPTQTGSVVRVVREEQIRVGARLGDSSRVEVRAHPVE